jgi:predicted RecB family endonuclease
LVPLKNLIGATVKRLCLNVVRVNNSFDEDQHMDLENLEQRAKDCVGSTMTLDVAEVTELIRRFKSAASAAATMYFGGGSAEQIKTCAEYIVDMAITHGQVLTVTQCPLHPLTMGNYHTVVSIRPARGCSK